MNPHQTIARKRDGNALSHAEIDAFVQQYAQGAIPDYQMAAYALTGFANFSSVGIQIGGIGALAPERRPDLARLGLKALFVGFVATLLNASVAGLISDLSK